MHDIFVVQFLSRTVYWRKWIKDQCYARVGPDNLHNTKRTGLLIVMCITTITGCCGPVFAVSAQGVMGDKRVNSVD